MRDAPLDGSVTHNADAVRVGNQDGTNEKAGFFNPGCAGHFTVAVLREPAGENGIADGIISTRQNGCDAGADRAFADSKLSIAGNQRGVADQNTRDIGDGIKRTGRAVKRDSEVARAEFGGRFFLSVHGEGEKRNTPEEHHELE
jgi:hypothetical protein